MRSIQPSWRWLTGKRVFVAATLGELVLKVVSTIVAIRGTMIVSLSTHLLRWRKLLGCREWVVGVKEEDKRVIAGDIVKGLKAKRRWSASVARGLTGLAVFVVCKSFTCFTILSIPSDT